jgi:uncharacterized hydantoinase/oxoprolinase family protein
MADKHTYEEYKFPNGETIKCTVSFRYLAMLRDKNKKIYERLNNGMMNGVGNDIVEAVYVLYGAYLCACYAGENGGIDNIKKESEFIDALDDDIMDVLTVCAELINKKKN